MPTPSDSSVPSAVASNGRMRSVGLNALSWVKTLHSVGWWQTWTGAGGMAGGRPPRRFADGVLDGDQPGRAGRVQGVRGALEVEPVGDARRRQVRHETDRRLGLLRPEALADGLAHGAELVLRQSGEEI